MKTDDAPSSAFVDRRIHNRRIVSERRKPVDGQEFAGEERRKSPRRKVERRRMIDPTTCERDYSDDEIEFMKAMDDYKRKSGRMFPTWSEVLEVVRALGYAKTVAAPVAELATEPAVN
jgi:hypothetical protein